MKCASKKYWLGLTGIVAFVVVFIWAAAGGPSARGKHWLRVSTPVVSSFTNSGVVTGTVAFSVSNVGHKAVDFQIRWFECKADGSGAFLDESPPWSAWIPLSAGKSTNLTIPVSLGSVPVENCLCCSMIWWMERRATWRDLRDRAASWSLGLLDISWLPWEREHLSDGYAFAANIDVADYFRRMHGLTREKWLEDLARTRTVPARNGSKRYPARWPTVEEMLELEARSAFVDFCQSTTDSSGREAVASPKAARP